MLDALPGLYQAASNVINLVLAGEIAIQVRQLVDEESRAYKNLRRLGKVHTAQKEEFSSGQYIDLKRAQRGILGTEEDSFIEPVTVGLVNVFYLSNIASLFVTSFIDGRRREVLEMLDSGFAGLFLADVDFPRQPGYDQESFRAWTMNLALDIRTQYCMTILRQEFGENYDPDHIIHVCFSNTLEEEDVVLKGWDIGGLRTIDLLPDDHQRIFERIKVIQEVSQDLGNEDILKPHKDMFEWSKLQTDLIEWAKLISGGIEAEVNHLGGAETIRMSIESAKAQKAGGVRNDRVGTEDNAGTRVALDSTPSDISHPPGDTPELTLPMQLRGEL